MLSRLPFAILLAFIFTLRTAQAFDHGVPPAEVLRILEHNKFQIVRRTSAIPVQPLVQATFLPRNRSLSSFLADPGRPFQSGTHAWMDDSRPMRQLVLAALSSDYIVTVLLAC